MASSNLPHTNNNSNIQNQAKGDFTRFATINPTFTIHLLSTYILIDFMPKFLSFLPLQEAEDKRTEKVSTNSCWYDFYHYYFFVG